MRMATEWPASKCLPLRRGPGGGTCWAMTCTKCVEAYHPVLPDIKWDTCKTVAENGGCDCNWAGDKCTGPYGTCVYTG